MIPGTGPATPPLTAQPMHSTPSAAPAAADPLPAGLGVAVVVSRYNERITGRLLDGAVAALVAGGVPRDRIEVAWVPGAFELPFIADVMAASGRHAAVLCLGAIIRGETTHDQHIARAVATGIEAVARERGLPVLFGVLTCDTLAQAEARAGVVAAAGRGSEAARQAAAAAVTTAAGASVADATAVGAKAVVENKGVECATAALEMIALVTRLRGGPAGPSRS